MTNNNTKDIAYVGIVPNLPTWIAAAKHRAIKTGMSAFAKVPRAWSDSAVNIFCEGGKTFYGFRVKEFKKPKLA